MSQIDNLLKPRLSAVDVHFPTTARITMEPLERGFGHTLGNALRRVLLSSITGCAIVKVQIAGVTHEYKAISGVKEDVIDILLNIKGLAIRIFHKDKAVITLKKQGPGVVKAQDCVTGSDVEIVNPEHVIATLTRKNCALDITMYVERGRGYQPASQRSRQEEEDEFAARDLLLLDADFSPIRHVAYSIESTRVEQYTDLDKLIIDLKTNGTITPEDAIKQAATILYNQLAPFAQIDMSRPVGKAEEEVKINPIFLEHIESLQLDVRSANCLKAEHIVYVGDLVQKTPKDLFKTPNLGKKSLEKIEAQLSEYGLKLGMNIDGWPPHALREPAVKDYSR